MIIGPKGDEMKRQICDEYTTVKVDLYQMNDDRIDLALVRYKYDVVLVLLQNHKRFEDELKHNIVDVQNFLDKIENAKRLLWATKVIVLHEKLQYQNILTDMLKTRQQYLPDFTIFDIELEDNDEQWKVVKASIIADRAIKTICHEKTETVDKAEQVVNEPVQEQAQQEQLEQAQEQPVQAEAHLQASELPVQQQELERLQSVSPA
jgi:hypothetical protein